LALRRQDIERRDFPIARRGYEPDAVDAHLRSLADRLDEQGATAASLAGAASEQVRAIVTAAEASAAEIRATADEEARLTRDRAATEAQAHLARVEEAAKAMLQRADEMEGELGKLVETLREGAGRLASDLAQVRGSMGDVRVAAPPADKGPTVEPPAQDAAAAAGQPDDSEGARLIALNMALNGTPREETDRYLEENFQLADRAALLDEVYARVG